MAEFRDGIPHNPIVFIQADRETGVCKQFVDEQSPVSIFTGTKDTGNASCKIPDVLVIQMLSPFDHKLMRDIESNGEPIIFGVCTVFDQFRQKLS